MVNTCFGAAGFGGGEIAGFEGFAVNVRRLLGSDAIPFKVCMTLTLTLLDPGVQSAVGVKVRVDPEGLKVPAILALASSNTSRVTVSEAIPEMVNFCFGAAGFGGALIAGLGGLTVNAFTTAQSDGCPVTFPVCIAVMRYAPTAHAEGAVTDQPPSD
ncbi:hypothetical protein D3C85_730150 [compost metagenome]